MRFRRQDAGRGKRGDSVRTFLLQSCSTLVFVMAAANLLFAVLLLRQFARKRLPVLLCSAWG